MANRNYFVDDSTVDEHGTEHHVVVAGRDPFKQTCIVQIVAGPEEGERRRLIDDAHDNTKLLYAKVRSAVQVQLAVKKKLVSHATREIGIKTKKHIEDLINDPRGKRVAIAIADAMINAKSFELVQGVVEGFQSRAEMITHHANDVIQANNRLAITAQKFPHARGQIEGIIKTNQLSIENTTAGSRRDDPPPMEVLQAECPHLNQLVADIPDNVDLPTLLTHIAPFNLEVTFLRALEHWASEWGNQYVSLETIRKMMEDMPCVGFPKPFSFEEDGTAFVYFCHSEFHLQMIWIVIMTWLYHNRK